MSTALRHPRGVLDTSAVLRLQHIRDPMLLPEEPLVSAITLAHDLPVYTCNPKDFEGIEGLEVVPVRVGIA